MHGAIDTGLETHTSTGLAGGAWLSVRTGPVLTYCEHPDHATRRAAAWNAAMLPGRQHLPREGFLPDVGRDRVIAQVTAQHHDSWDITGYTAAAAPDHRPVIYVRTGAITFRCYDQVALAAIREAWANAAMIINLLWRPRVARRY